MTMTLRKITFFGISLLAMTMGKAAPALALDETTVYGIASFGGTGQCGTSNLSHSVHASTAAAFSNPFGLLKTVGLWDSVKTANNTGARGSYFTDSTKGGSCMCTADDVSATAGADAADVIYVHTHGNQDGVSSGLVMGNSSYDCEARTNQNMYFGDPKGGGDLDIAVVKACESGDYDVWKGGNYRKQMVASDSSFSMWNAFHGDSSCGSHVTSYVSHYAWLSMLDGAGENWLDAAYDDNASANSDDCPVSIVFGGSNSARVSMYEYGGWLDRKNTGTKSGSTIFFMSGCDPAGGSVLP
jgi:hypothetical protein